jgi:hypothetical protein
MARFNWLALASFVVATGCRGIAAFPLAPDAGGDADADVDTDVDTDVDADTDSDIEADADVESVHVPTGIVTDVGFTEPVSAQVAGTSLLLHADLTCETAEAIGETIQIKATNALVSAPERPGQDEFFSFAVGPACAGADIRVTFPLSLGDRVVTFQWRQLYVSEWTEIGDCSIQVAPVGTPVSTTLIGGTGERVSVIAGLEVAQVADVGTCDDAVVDGFPNAPASLTVTDGALESVAVVACTTEAWFLPYREPPLDAWHATISPDAEDGDGPDRIGEIAYAPASIGADDRVLIASPSLSDDAGGGLFDIGLAGRGVAPSRLAAGSHANALEVVASHDSFQAGVYLAFGGSIHLATWSDAIFGLGTFSTVAIDALSIAVGDGGIYGDYAMYAMRCDDADSSCSTWAIDVLDSSGRRETLGALAPGRRRLAAASRGLFNGYVYAVWTDRITIISPVDFAGSPAILTSFDLQFVDATVYDPDILFDHFPPGLYVLAVGFGTGATMRVLRISQPFST